jgi:hypothetical protein
MVCVPVSLVVGAHEKLPEEFMLLFEMEEPLSESLTEYVGVVNPAATTVNDSVCPLIMLELGESDWIESEGAELTVSVSCVVAVSPDESVTVMVRLCIPTSLLAGVQLNWPAVFMLPLVMLVPPAESVSAYDGPLNPVVEIVKETGVPTETLVLGDSDCSETEVLAYANAGANDSPRTARSIYRPIWRRNFIKSTWAFNAHVYGSRVRFGSFYLTTLTKQLE